MSAQVTINPILTSNAAGSFNIESTGFIQGTMLDDPAKRFALAGGILAATETLPMWGGVGIFEDVAASQGGYVGSPGNPAGVLGGNVGRATAMTGATGLTGFSMFNQAHGMINSPQSPVPLAGSGMSVNFFRIGSGARIAVQCDPVLADLEGEIINSQVSWDFTNQKLIAYNGTALAVNVLDLNIGNSMIVSYDSGTGFATWNRTGSCAIIQI